MNNELKYNAEGYRDKTAEVAIRAADKPRKQEKPRSVTLRGTAQWPLCFSRRFSWRRANWRSASASRSFRETFFRASFPCSR